jgi:hypothetical protein
VRNQPAAVVSILVFGFVVEPTVLALADGVGRYLPLVALTSGVSGIDDDGDLLAPGLAALALAGWVAVTAVAATIVLRERDLT